MFQHCYITLTLAVCLAAATAAGAPKPRNRWEMPDPFAPCNHAHAARPPTGGERLMGVRVVWVPRDRAETFALLLAACLCLAALEMKVLRRTSGGHERLANTLAGALRSGALEFDGGPRPQGSLWEYTEPDEDEEPQCKALQTEVNRSRYALLGYHASNEDPLQSAVVKVSYLGSGPDPDTLVRDQDLLLGVPREFLKPELMQHAAAVKPARPLRALTAGRAEGDDPGEGVP